MRPFTFLTAALIATGVPLVTAQPALAAGNVICVGAPTGPCTTNAPSISAAIDAADANTVADTILVGPGTYSDGPFELDGSSHPLTLKGSGQAATILTMPEGPWGETYLEANHARVQDLTVRMKGPTSGGDTGLLLHNFSEVDRVTVDGTATSNADGMRLFFGATVRRALVDMTPDTGSRGIYSEGDGPTIEDSTINADVGVKQTGISFGGFADTLTLSRLTIRSNTYGVWLEGGAVDIDNALIDLGTSSGTGLLAANDNAGTDSKTITADHLTIIGGWNDSIGARASSSNPEALQHSSIMMTNSIVRGPETSFATDADNDGTRGGPSVATIEVSYSDYDFSTTSSWSGDHGTAEVVTGPGNLRLDPQFANPAGGDYRLAPASPLVDAGDPGTGGSMLDRDRAPRVVDGDGDGTAIRDMGAYELQDTVAPDTVITKHPPKRLPRRTAAFEFSSEPGASFRCKLDDGTWRDCTSPWRQRVKLGLHTFRVRAVDAAGNVDPTPATFTFRRVTG